MRNSYNRLLLIVLIGLPLLSLGLGAIAWLRYGLDLPMFDDWRGYISGQMDSLDLNYLFSPVNATLYPVGLVLDSLAQRYLDGNTIAYQFLSMVLVLGGLLFLQWTLLKYALDNTLQAAICFSLTLLMLQPGSYWGNQNLAYHQALPLIFLLSALVLIFITKMSDFFRQTLVAILGILAGFSYISGAFATLAAGTALLGIGFLRSPSPQRVNLLRGGAVLATVGLLCSAIQFFIAVLPYMGNPSQANAPLAFPTELDFWIFLGGKLGRSLLLPQQHPLPSLLLVLAVVLLTSVVIILLVWRIASRKSNNPQFFRVATIFIVLTAAVFSYLILVAAGRAHLRDDNVKSALQLFSFGFTRFHFFWATLLWPWLLAACIVLWKEYSYAPYFNKINFVGLGVILFVLGLIVAGGGVAHKKWHHGEFTYRQSTVSCLLNELQKGQGIYCPEFVSADGKIRDFTKTYMYARSIGASFIRNFPILRLPIGTLDPKPFFRLQGDVVQSQWRNVEHTKDLKWPLLTLDDPQWLVQTGHSKEMANCRILDVDVLMRAEKFDVAQIFYRPIGSSDFSEGLAQTLALQGQTSASERLSFRLESAVGFEDALRFDPVTKAQKLDIVSLDVHCRLQIQPVSSD